MTRAALAILLICAGCVTVNYPRESQPPASPGGVRQVPYDQPAPPGGEPPHPADPFEYIVMR